MVGRRGRQKYTVRIERCFVRYNALVQYMGKRARVSEVPIQYHVKGHALEQCEKKKCGSAGFSNSNRCIEKEESFFFFNKVDEMKKNCLLFTNILANFVNFERNWLLLVRQKLFDIPLTDKPVGAHHCKQE